MFQIKKYIYSLNNIVIYWLYLFMKINKKCYGQRFIGDLINNIFGRNNSFVNV